MEESNTDLNRRDTFKAAVAAKIGLTATARAQTQKSRSNLIRIENEKKAPETGYLIRLKLSRKKGKSPLPVVAVI